MPGPAWHPRAAGVGSPAVTRSRASEWGNVEQGSVSRFAQKKHSGESVALQTPPFFFCSRRWDAGGRRGPLITTGKVKLISAPLEPAFEKFLFHRDLQMKSFFFFFPQAAVETCTSRGGFYLQWHSRAQWASLTTRKGAFCAPLILHNAVIFFVWIW